MTAVFRLLTVPVLFGMMRGIYERALGMLLGRDGVSTVLETVQLTVLGANARSAGKSPILELAFENQQSNQLKRVPDADTGQFRRFKRRFQTFRHVETACNAGLDEYIVILYKFLLEHRFNWTGARFSHVGIA